MYRVYLPKRFVGSDILDLFRIGTMYRQAVFEWLLQLFSDAVDYLKVCRGVEALNLSLIANYLARVRCLCSIGKAPLNLPCFREFVR